MVNNEAKPKQIPSMLGLKQSSFKRKGKGVSRELEYDLKKKLAQVKPCPKSKKFKKKRHNFDPEDDDCTYTESLNTPPLIEVFP